MKDTPVTKRASRFAAGIPAVVVIGGEEISCTAHNLSRTGVLLVGKIPPADSIEVSVTLASTAGDLRFTTTGRIMRREEGDAPESSHLAIEFLAADADKSPEFEALLARVIEGVSPAVLESLPRDASAREIREALDRIPLPHRTTLAARAKPREREILFHDTHPSVVDALARNPALLPHEMIALLRMPILPPHTLQTLAGDSRWVGNPQIAVMIATHRNTPHGTANQMVSRMPLALLDKVIQAPGLSPALRATVLRRLKR